MMSRLEGALQSIHLSQYSSPLSPSRLPERFHSIGQREAFP